MFSFSFFKSEISLSEINSIRSYQISSFLLRFLFSRMRSCLFKSSTILVNHCSWAFRFSTDLSRPTTSPAISFPRPKCKNWFSQDEDSGYRILRDPAGNVRKSHCIPQESTESGSSIPVRTFFQWKMVRNHRKNSQKVPAGILLPLSGAF